MLCLYRLPLLSACFVSAFCGSLLRFAHTADLRQEEADDNAPKADKEHTPKDAPDAKHVCASCCDVVGMVSSRCSGQRAPPAIFLYQFTSVLRSLVVETTARTRPIRKQTQIADMPKNNVEHEGQTADISHTSRVLQSLALATILR